MKPALSRLLYSFKISITTKLSRFPAWKWPTLNDVIFVFDLLNTVRVINYRVGPDLCFFLPDTRYPARLSGMPCRICRIIRLFHVGYRISSQIIQSNPSHQQYSFRIHWMMEIKYPILKIMNKKDVKNPFNPLVLTIKNKYLRHISLYKIKCDY